MPALTSLWQIHKNLLHHVHATGDFFLKVRNAALGRADDGDKYEAFEKHDNGPVDKLHRAIRAYGVPAGLRATEDLKLERTEDNVPLWNVLGIWLGEIRPAQDYSKEDLDKAAEGNSSGAYAQGIEDPVYDELCRTKFPTDDAAPVHRIRDEEGPAAGIPSPRAPSVGSDLDLETVFLKHRLSTRVEHGTHAQAQDACN